MFKRTVTVAVNLFHWSLEQGFIGIAAYIACWVFLFPVMLTICIAGAFLGWFIERGDKRRPLDPNAPRNAAERQQWEDEDRAYEEARLERTNKLSH